MCCQVFEVTPAVLTTPVSQSVSLDVSDKPRPLESRHDTKQTATMTRWHVRKCERRIPGGSDEPFESETARLAACGTLLIWRITGHLVPDAPRINISFIKSSGAQSSVFHTLWFDSWLSLMWSTSAQGRLLRLGTLLRLGLDFRVLISRSLRLSLFD